MRRGWVAGHSQFISGSFFAACVKIFDAKLTRNERVRDRLGGKKKPDGLTVQLNQAKSLRRIGDALEGIYDVLRLRVYFSYVQQTFQARDSRANFSLGGSTAHESEGAPCSRRFSPVV